MADSLRIAYLLEDTELSGGVRVQLAQADALIARGHRVRLVTKGLPLTWRNSRAEWVYVDNFQQYDAQEDDFVIGTFWTTVEPAWSLARERAVHLSQGYEGAFTAYQDIKPQIDAAYRLPIPKLIVTRSLIPVLQQFTGDITCVGQIVDEEFYRSRVPAENEPMRVLLSGQSQADMKGIHKVMALWRTRAGFIRSSI